VLIIALRVTRGSLLVAKGPDRRHPVKAGAHRAPPLRGFQALTGRRRPGKGLAMQVRSAVTRFVAYHYQFQRSKIRRSQVFLRRKSIAGISGFRRDFRCCFHPVNPGEGASAWQRKRNGRDLVRPTTTDRRAVVPSIPAFSGSPKPLADSLLARRASSRLPPMTTNPADDSSLESGFPRNGSGIPKQCHFHPGYLIRTDNSQVLAISLTVTE
jgi:hypothetical protein